MIRSTAFLVAAVALMLTAQVAGASVRSVSTDGEATIYVSGAFSADFDLLYRARLTPGNRNTSWTSLSILLLGSNVPGPGVSVGLAADTKHRKVIPFTYVVYPKQQYDYRSYSGDCDNGCTIELRGDAYRIYAYSNGKLLSSWLRSDLYLQPSDSSA